jgi:uncharacterized protein YdgA (DUF945 family)
VYKVRFAFLSIKARLSFPHHTIIIMKKLAFGVAGLLLFAVIASLGATFYFSRQAEQQAMAWMKKLEETGPYLKMTSDYQRGLLTSTQRITIALPGGKGSESIVIKNVIRHGPFPGFRALGMATIEHSWELDEAVAKELAKGFGDGQPFAATTTVALDGAGITEFKGAPANYSSVEDKVTWQGFTGTLRFTRGMESYTGDIVAPQFSVAGKQGVLKINGLAFKFDQRRMPGFEELYLGKMTISLDGVSFKDGTSDTRIEKVVFETGATSADNQFMDVKAAIKVAKVTAAEVEATDVDYAVSMRHLHAQSFMQLTKAMQAAGPKPGAAKQDTAALMAQMSAMQKTMKVHGLALLKNDPVIAIDRINVKMKEGEIKASGTLRLPGVTEADMDQPFSLIGKVDAAATASIPEAFARNQYAKTKARQMKVQLGSVSEAQMTEAAAMAGSEFAMMLAGFGQQGYVDSDGAQLKTTIAFKGGALLVNGKPFNPMAASPPPRAPAAQSFSAKPPFPARR